MQDGFNNYTCVCKLGLSGRNCEINRDDCTPNPCKNGAACQVSVKSTITYMHAIKQTRFNVHMYRIWSLTTTAHVRLATREKTVIIRQPLANPTRKI